MRDFAVYVAFAVLTAWPLAAEEPTVVAADGGENAVGASTDGYLLAVFSSQGSPKTPNRTHNWGVALHVKHGAGERKVVRADTISWMPRDLQVDALRVWVRPGVNLSCEQSLMHAANTRQRITLWGIWPTSRETYERFLQQKARLRSGRYGYQCLDTIGEAGARRNGCNCIHALADFANLLPHNPVAAQPYGDESASLIARLLVKRGLVETSDDDFAWVIQDRGWDRWPIVKRRAAMDVTATAKNG